MGSDGEREEVGWALPTNELVGWALPTNELGGFGIADRSVTFHKGGQFAAVAEFL